MFVTEWPDLHRFPSKHDFLSNWYILSRKERIDKEIAENNSAEAGAISLRRQELAAHTSETGIHK